MFKYARFLGLVAAVLVLSSLPARTIAQGDFVEPELVLMKFQKTGLDAHIWLGTPDALQVEFDTALAKLDVPWPANQLLDMQTAVYTFSDSGISEIAIPLISAESSRLTATNAVTPDDAKAAKVLGGLYFPALNPSAIVVVYVPAGDELRFYTSGGERVTAPPLEKHRFVGLNGKVTRADALALISARLTCFTVGLDQLCFASAQPTASRNSLVAGSGSDTNGALYDIFGDDQRSACATALKSWQFASGTPAACTPNMIFAGLSEPTTIAGFADYTLIAYMSVFTSVKIDTLDNPGGEVYDATTGVKTDVLPKGTFVMFDTMPGAGPDATVVLLLVETGGGAFYIPGRHVEGIAVSGNAHLQGYIGDECGGTCWP
jgi:hypothetical protein